MTAPMQRIEVITRGERRRRWSIEEKRAIVAESLEPGIRAAEVIRRHGITSGQLYSWRHQLARRIDRQAGAAASFARVEVWSGEPQMPEASVVGPRAVPAIAESRERGLIEIALPCGTTVRVDARVDDRALRRVLDALRAR
jgi:transposase